MFSRRNNSYCELLQNCKRMIRSKIELYNVVYRIKLINKNYIYDGLDPVLKFGYTNNVHVEGNTDHF